MRRFFIEEIEERDGYCVISGSEARHISRVLRMGRGDHVILMDGKGDRFEVVIESVRRNEVRVKIKRPLPKPPSSPVKIDLCQALLKSRSMDYLIEKTSELGVDSIIPFTSKRTVVRLDERKAGDRVRHWREIARCAAKQSDRTKPAEISLPVSFKDMTGRWKHRDVLKVAMWEEEGEKDLKDLLRSTTPAGCFVGMVGPEGGFSGEEIGIAREAGFTPVSVGSRILRAETAAITLVGIVQYEWGDLSLNESE